MLNFPIYLDHNATTPCDPRVVDAMIPFFTNAFGNAASRNHPFGWQAEEAVDYAREQVAKLIGADPKEIIFTSGATEGDNLAIKGVYEMYASKGNHIITCNIEHKAVLDTCKHIEKEGGEVTYLKVKDNGLIDLEELEAAIKPTTILIAIFTFTVFLCLFCTTLSSLFLERSQTLIAQFDFLCRLGVQAFASSSFVEFSSCHI